MANGMIYVPVDANTANGIMTMDTSSGSQESGYWLYWNENGYTGINWYWEESNNYVKTGWKNYVQEGKLTCEGSHSINEDGLREHILGGHADNLNAILGPWPTGDKMQFVGKHYNEFLNARCLLEL